MNVAAGATVSAGGAGAEVAEVRGVGAAVRGGCAGDNAGVGTPGDAFPGAGVPPVGLGGRVAGVPASVEAGGVAVASGATGDATVGAGAPPSTWTAATTTSRLIDAAASRYRTRKACDARSSRFATTLATYHPQPAGAERPPVTR